MSTTTGQHGAARLSVPANVELLLVNVTSAGREPVRDREIPIPVNSLGVEETISMDMVILNTLFPRATKTVVFSLFRLLPTVPLWNMTLSSMGLQRLASP